MIPDYQSIMLPLLRFVEDGDEHRIGELIEPLGKSLGLPRRTIISDASQRPTDGLRQPRALGEDLFGSSQAVRNNPPRSFSDY